MFRISVRAALLALALTAALGGLVPAAADSRSSPLLGARAFAPHGSGFGTSRPSEFFNGGDPSGFVQKIHWKSWGGASAFGVGRNAIFRPAGGYYAKLATVRLWAHGLRHCPGSQRPAYTRLSIRAPSRPGGPLGPWRRWSGASTICSF